MLMICSMCLESPSALLWATFPVTAESPSTWSHTGPTSPSQGKLWGPVNWEFSVIVYWKVNFLAGFFNWISVPDELDTFVWACKGFQSYPERAGMATRYRMEREMNSLQIQRVNQIPLIGFPVAFNTFNIDWNYVAWGHWTFEKVWLHELMLRIY